MCTIRIDHLTASEALSLNSDVQSAGLVVNQDYTWRYYPPDNFATHEPSGVEFSFRQDSMASFFSIKWSQLNTYHK